MQPPIRTFDEVRRCLERGSTAERCEAAGELRGFPLEALPPLCRALEDRNPEVRRVAAESLGCIGDPRATPALLAALRSSLGGRSGFVAAGYGVVWGGAVALSWCLVAIVCTTVLYALIWRGLPESLAFGMLGGMIGCWIVPLACQQVSRRRKRNRVCAAIAQALVEIGKHSPSPELRSALRDLKAVALDVVQQEQATRVAAMRAAAEIDAMTAAFRHLPIAGSLPVAGGAALPRPGLSGSDRALQREGGTDA